MDLLEIFCQIDDFCKEYSELSKKHFLSYENIGNIRAKTKRGMTTSEVVTVLIYYAMCSEEFKTFKAFYKHTHGQLKSDFRGLLSYGRITELKQEVMVPMTLFLKSIFSECNQKSFIDSTRIEACGIKREYSHRVLKGVARKGKTTDGWFFGTKLHAIFNEFSEIVYCCFTSGNVADNNNDLMRKFASKIDGKLFGDKGYIINKPLWEKLYKEGLQIIHHVKANMKNILMPLQDKMDLSKRANICEGAFSKLKSRMSLQCTRIRSIYGYVINSLSMVIAYQLWAHERAFPLKAAKLDHSKNAAIAVA